MELDTIKIAKATIKITEDLKEIDLNYDEIKVLLSHLANINKNLRGVVYKKK